MDGAEGPLPGFEPATRKKEPELVDDACHPELLVEDHRIGRQSPLIGSSTLAVAEGLDGFHPARTVLRRDGFANCEVAWSSENHHAGAGTCIILI